MLGILSSEVEGLPIAKPLALILQTTFDALADDAALKLSEYAHHFQHTLCHGVKLLRTINYKRTQLQFDVPVFC